MNENNIFDKVEVSSSSNKEVLPEDVHEQGRTPAAPPYAHWRRRAYIVWAIVGLGLVFAGIIYIAGIIWQALAAAAIAVFVAFMFHVPINKMEARGVPRVAGALLCMLVICLFAGLVFVAVVPTLTVEIANLATNFPDYANQAKETIESAKMYGMLGMSGEQSTAAIDAAIKWASEQGVAALMSDTASGLLGGMIDFGTGLMIVFIGLICAFWLLVDLPKISAELRSLVPESRQEDLDILSDAFGTAIYGWLKATILSALVTGLLCFTVFVIFGVPYSALLALLCGILYVIPYLGGIVAPVLAGAVGLIVSPIVALIAFAATLVIVNGVANFLAPKLMKNSVNLHPAVILVMLLVGGALGGIWGMLVAIPISAAIQCMFVTYFEARTGRSIASPDGALFREPPSEEELNE